MNVNGSDCSILIKTQYREIDVPYTEETIREAYSLLKEEAAIEGNGERGGIRVGRGVTGCVVAPLGIGSAPLLLYLAFGSAGLPVFVSETRNLFQFDLQLLPFEDGDRFTLVQDRGGVCRKFDGCAVSAFELRFERGQSVKLKLDVSGSCPADVYPFGVLHALERRERYHGDCVAYKINGSEYKNIYGLTVLSKKTGGTDTELWIKRNLQQGTDLPGLIEELTITAQLPRNTYETRSHGVFRITLKRLVLVSDETTVDCADGVMGPLRYHVAGTVYANVFTVGNDLIG